jgi:hypothetical protein
VNREDIHHLANLYGAKAQDRSGNVHIACPLAATLRADGLPSHRDGRDDKLALSVKIEESGPSVCHCFACGAGGSLISVFNEAHEFVGGFAIPVEFISATEKGGLGAALVRLRRGRVSAEKIRRAPSNLDKYVAECSRYVPQYLVERRGIVKADVDRWRIGFDAALSPEPWKGAAGAAVFPVWEEKGKLVGAARRTVHDGVEPRFFDTPGVWKSEVFYGEHAIDTTIERVHITEGVIGTIFAARVLPNAIGMLGALNEVGTVRFDKLKRWCSQVILVLDNDRAGKNAVDGYLDARNRWRRGLREQLRHGFVVKVARLPQEWGGKPTKDPADIPAAALLEAVKDAEYL